MKVKAITAREARKINLANGMSVCDDDVKTYWAATEDETETIDFETKEERDEFVKRNNSKEEDK